MKKFTLFFIWLMVNVCLYAQVDTTKVTPFKIMINGQEQGPFTLDQLKQMIQDGQLFRNTMVWQQGMTSWSEAEQVPELNDLFKSIPSTQVQSSADTVKITQGKKVKVKNAYYYNKKSTVNLAVCGGLLGGALLGVITWSTGDRSDLNNAFGYFFGGLLAIAVVEGTIGFIQRGKSKKLAKEEAKVTVTASSTGIGIAIHF